MDEFISHEEQEKQEC